MGSSKEGDPGNLGSCDDYWQMGFCSLPTRLSFRRGPLLGSKFDSAYTCSAVCMEILENSTLLPTIAGRPTSCASEQVRRRSTSSLRLLYCSHRKHGMAEETCKHWAEAYLRTEMPHRFSSGLIYPVLGLVRKAKSNSAISERTPSPTRPSRIATMV